MNTKKKQKHLTASSLVFNLEENARALQAQLLFLGYDAVIEPGEDGTYRVYSGSFEKLDNAAKMEQILRKAGFSTYIVQ